MLQILEIFLVKHWFISKPLCQKLITLHELQFSTIFRAHSPNQPRSATHFGKKVNHIHSISRDVVVVRVLAWIFPPVFVCYPFCLLTRCSRAGRHGVTLFAGTGIGLGKWKWGLEGGLVHKACFSLSLSHSPSGVADVRSGLDGLP